MPKVPEYTPNVSLRPAYRQDIDVRATPDSFGAAAGRGMEQLAAGLGNVGEAMQRVQALETETIARSQRNEFIRAKDELLYGENGFLTKEGRAAVDGFSDYERQLGELRRKYSSGLTPAQQHLFARAVEPIETDAKRSALKHRGSALKSFVVQESASGAQNFKNEAVRSYSDPAQWQKYAAAGIVEIRTLGGRLGWSPEKLKAEEQTYLSDAHKLTALEIANADPIAAIEYVSRNRDAMTPVDHLNIMRSLMPTVAPAITRDAVGVRGAASAVPDAGAMDAARPGRMQFAAQGLSSEAYSLLGTIAGTESPAYNMLNGGERFNDFSDHPRRQGAGGTSTAAGRYQFVRGTWDRVAQALGLSDFSPQSQDVGAWWLAQQDYKTRTGRDLSADLQAGNYAAVRSGLAGTWEGLAKLSDEEFARRMQGAGGAAVGRVTFSPRVEKALSELPASYATRLREAAVTGVAQVHAQEAAQIKAQRLAVVDDYKLRIANEDASLTRQDILDDPTLDKGDKATLLNSYSLKFSDALETRQAVAAYQAGQFAIDPYDSNGKKLVDRVWTTLSATVEKEQLQSSLEDLVRQAGIAPQPAVNAIHNDLVSRSPVAVARAANLAARLNAINPEALLRRDGGREVRDLAVMYSHLTDATGLTPAMAAQRIIDARDPDKARERAALMDSEPVKKFVKEQATESAVRDIFDPGLIGFDPNLGETPAQSAAAVAEYREMLEESIVDAAGNHDVAKALAADRFKRRYGATEFAVSGKNVVTRLPPEVTYPAGVDGTHGYIRDQAKADLKRAGVSASDIYLLADAMTERDFRTGKPARYQVFYRTPDGVLERHRLPFYAEPPKPEEIAAARRAKSERRRDINMIQTEFNQDRDRQRAADWRTIDGLR